MTIYDKIEKPIIFFDIETTGVDLKNDKIIELCAIKYTPDRSKITLQKYFNPQREIHPEAFKIHNIDGDFLKNYPTFKDSVDELFEFFNGCDLGGYNCIHFDIPILYEEFYKCGKNLNIFNINIIDCYNLLNKYETRKLSDVYRRFFGKDFDNSHSAEADIEATIKVFEKQIELYDISDKSIREISNEIRSTSNGERILDISGWFRYKNGIYYYGKGKWKGTPVKENLNYLKWMFENDSLENNSRVIGKKLWEKLNLDIEHPTKIVP